MGVVRQAADGAGVLKLHWLFLALVAGWPSGSAEGYADGEALAFGPSAEPSDEEADLLLLNSIRTERGDEAHEDEGANPPADIADDAAAVAGDVTQSASDIVVVGARSAFVEPEQSYDFDRLLSYGASTVGDALEALSIENGDAEPTFLVNGRRIEGRGSIEDFPVESVERIEALPRGSAARVGGSVGERIYNIVLRDAALARTLGANRKTALNTGWSLAEGEAQFAYIRGPDRVNFSLGASYAEPLLESELNLEQPIESLLASALGNVLPNPPASEIDPLLSALAGEGVFIAGAPRGLVSPTLADFAANANLPHIAPAGRYRTLRSESRGYEATLASNKQIAPWLSASLDAQWNWQTDTSLDGAPSALFGVPNSLAASPFSTDVILSLSDPDRPLRGQAEYSLFDASAMFTASAGEWTFPFSFTYSDNRSTLELQHAGVAGPIELGPASNPFDGSLPALIPVSSETIESRTTSKSVSIGAEGTVLELPAGAMLVRSSIALRRTTLSSSISFADPPAAFVSDEETLEAGVTIPIVSENWTSGLGAAELSAATISTDFGEFGAATHHQASLTWRWRDWLRLAASVSERRTPLAPDLRYAPVHTEHNTRVFDPIRAETVDVVSISGGNPALRPETQSQNLFSLGLGPFAPINLQLDLDYARSERRNLIGSLWDADAALATAFADRFERDGEGRLVAVDYRPVNLEALRIEELRTSAGFTIPLYESTPLSDAAGSSAARARPRLQANMAYTRVLDAHLLTRTGVAEVNLLDGGPFGMSGAVAPEHATASMAVTDRGSGARVSLTWRGASDLNIGTTAAPDRLHFDSYSRIDVAVFAEIGALFPDLDLLERTRISLSIENVADTVQSVRDQQGETPLAYQAGYRDPVGRAVRLELRRAF
jgi:hypothetical protein